MNTREDAGVSIEEIKEACRQAEEALAAVNAILRRLRDSEAAS